MFRKNIYLLLIIIFMSCNQKRESKQYIINNIKEYSNDIRLDVRSRDFNAIELIKSSSFTSYTNLKIEDLISSFDSLEWQDFIAEDDHKRYIDIIGKYNTNEYIIQFQILDNYRWELYAFEINKNTYTIDDVSRVLYILYTNKYQTK